MINVHMQDGKVTDKSLILIQHDMHQKHGRGFDIYHSEAHRGIILTERGAGLSLHSSVLNIKY